MVSKKTKIIVGFILIIMFFLMNWASIKENQTVDEGVHLVAGYSYWKSRDFRLNPEHPPFLKLLSSLPLIFLNPRLDFKNKAWISADQWGLGYKFLYQNIYSADLLLFVGRMPIIFLTLILALFIFKWAKKLWGEKIALIILVLFAFDANFLAHGHYITTDVGVTLFFYLTFYLFYYFIKDLQRGIFSKKRFMLLGILIGLTLASKFSGLIIIPILMILFLLSYLFFPSLRRISFLKILRGLFILALISFGVVWLCYFGETKKVCSSQTVQHAYAHPQDVWGRPPAYKSSIFLFLARLTNPQNKSGQILKKLCETVPVPAYSFFKGLVKLEAHNLKGHPSYLLGKRSFYGFWYYFPIAFLVKTPLALLIILSLTIFICFIKSKKLFFENPLLKWFLILPPLIYGIASLFSHITIGLRHIFLIYPFLYLLSGIFLSLIFKLKINTFLKKWLFTFIFLSQIIPTLIIAPHFMAFFNGLLVGPKQGPQVLIDSNIDWGQDLKKLSNYLKKNKINFVYLDYFGKGDPNYYGIRYAPLPSLEKIVRPNFKGTVVISATYLYWKEPYDFFRNIKPKKRIGFSIYVYQF